MTEILYAGPIPLDTMPQIVAACHFEQDALFLAENIPDHPIVLQKARRDLIRFTYFSDDTPCAAYTSGRIFQEDRELRWEKQQKTLRIVYLGAVDSTIEAALHEYGLRSKQKVLDALKKNSDPTYYYLFGERLRKDDLDQLAKVAQPGDFAVVRIPRILRYPVPQDDNRYARLLVREYHNKATGSVDLFRFQALEPWNE